MIILNDGCSFSRNRKEIVPPCRKRLNGRRESYCVFLPDMIDAHNIARSASGIESWGLTNWLKHNNKNTSYSYINLNYCCAMQRYFHTSFSLPGKFVVCFGTNVQKPRNCMYKRSINQS